MGLTPFAVTKDTTSTCTECGVVLDRPFLLTVDLLVKAILYYGRDKQQVNLTTLSDN